MENIAKETVEKYIREELKLYKEVFGSDEGFKEYISRKLRERLARA